MSSIRIVLFAAAASSLVVTESALAAEAALANAVEKCDLTAIAGLLEKQADVNAAQADGMTALHWAALHDDADLIKRLLATGADSNAANRYGVAPLALACKNGSAAAVQML